MCMMHVQVMVEAEFESGSLRGKIVTLFQRPDTPPELAEAACWPCYEPSCMIARPPFQQCRVAS